MSKMNKVQCSRRDFLAGSATLAGAAALSCMAGCSPQNDTAEETKEDSTASVQQSSYKDKPAEITDSEIVETLEADVVVCGAGNAGAAAVATAVEEGMSVILLQKVECVFTHGSGFAAVGSSLQKEQSIDVNGWEIVGDIQRNGGNNLGSWEVLGNWVNYSGEMADWIINKYKDTELGPFMVESPVEPDNEWHRTYPVAHLPRGERGIGGSRMAAIATALVEDAAAEGQVEVRYNTPAKQLRQDETGRVTGVVAQNENGEYILCNATKGVILATGGYEGNEEMRHDLMPQTIGLGIGYSRPDVTTGDGILMGLWAGGQIQRAPHCSNIHYDPGVAVPTLKGTPVPWLRVNKNGERFSNEDVNYDEVWAQDVRQPGCMHYQIFDDNYLNDMPDMGTTGMTQNSDWSELIPKALEEGNILKADTLEELAQLIEVPADTFKATVERYNQLAEGGYDYEPDFGKLGSKVKKIAKAPFYAIARQATCLTTLSGLEVNADMQVLDDSFQPIEGLWAAGNCSGNFYGGLVQRMVTPCMSVSRALLTGRIAAWRIAGKME
ncbi:FAD-dependent oxidoreductase [Adlercreutzia sp. ZJ141]|uniref:FAD-dependent oxidoreductase n=1 Tax=Adlercreutzia sp. ZJ141 TaxID=2709406 RepID=UPI0013EAF6B7|nr:FAD-dependent oxidoreductase [Adlercreutzia sp. ZJ141]